MFRMNADSHSATPTATKTARARFPFAAFALALSLCATVAAKNDETKNTTRVGRETKKESVEENGSAISTSRQKPRDPFVVPARVKREPKVVVKKEPQPMPVPGIETRLTAYRDLVRAASAGSRQAAPDKLSPYVIDELTITGIFRDGEGYGAFVAAEPTKLTFFVRPGMRTHDGVVKEVLPTGVKFSRTTRYDDGSVRQSEEFRALRKEKSGK